MKILVRTLVAGPDCVIQPGTVCDVPEGFASALIAAGYAQRVGEEPAIRPLETATLLREVETAVQPRKRARK